MKVNILLKIARQVEGERVFINAIKASTNKLALNDFLRASNISPTEEIDGVGCVVEVGILEDIEVDIDADAT